MSAGRDKVIQEIDQIPEDKLSEIYILLHYFRMGLQLSQDNSKSIINFAGCWSDLHDEVSEGLIKEICQRRQQSFLGVSHLIYLVDQVVNPCIIAVLVGTDSSRQKSISRLTTGGRSPVCRIPTMCYAIF